MVAVMNRRLIETRIVQIALAIFLIAIVSNTNTEGAEAKKVALTTTLQTPNDKTQREAAEVFLTFLELFASQQEELAVVERRQLDLALQEIFLSRGLGSEQKPLQLGKLATADLLLNAHFQASAKDGTQRVVVRVVEAKDGKIRGITASTVSSIAAEETAREVVRYLQSIVVAPDRETTTIAVGAFESLGQFDRLRPLELGVRDMLTTGLVNLNAFHIVQRSNMAQLVSELELVDAGLAQAPTSSKPTKRGAAYLLTGTLNEDNSDGYKVVVEGKLINVRTQKTIYSFQFRSEPEQLAAELSKAVLLTAGFLHKSQDVEIRPAIGRFETKTLLTNSLTDLYRFQRRSPIDFSMQAFRVPGIAVERRAGKPRVRTYVKSTTLLGKHLLRKSIDRLESILFMNPDDLVAAYALGFCYSIQIDSIGKADRSDVLLRRVATAETTNALRAKALRLLAEASYDHDRGHVDPSSFNRAANQILFAFEHMPPDYRDYRWARMVELLSSLQSRQKNYAATSRLIDIIVEKIDEVETPAVNRKLTLSVEALAFSLCRYGRDLDAEQDKARQLLTEWADSESALRKHAGALGLARIHEAERKHNQAADWYLFAANSYDKTAEKQNRYTRENLLVYAARNLRLAKRPKDGLKALLSFDPSWASTSLNRGYRDIEMGICLSELGDQERAVKLWVLAAEQVPHLVDNSQVVQLINANGGVPQREESEIQVRYLAGPNKNPVRSRYVATDGDRIFCSDLKQQILMFDIASESWTKLHDSVGRVSCMAFAGDHLWVGTTANGLWRCHLVGNEWTQWSKENGLPDPRVLSITANNKSAYVGIGTLASGGLVQITKDDDVRIFDDQAAPRTAATHTIILKDKVITRTLRSMHQLNVADGKWTQLKGPEYLGNPSLYVGQDGTWASRYGRELYRFTGSKETNEQFKGAWFPRGQGKAGYLVNFVEERAGDIWFGGSPWARFRSSGLYRLDKQSGKLTMFGPRDGFKTNVTYTISDGVWAQERLWVTTPDGLAEVTPVKKSGQ